MEISENFIGDLDNDELLLVKHSSYSESLIIESSNDLQSLKKRIGFCEGCKDDDCEYCTDLVTSNLGVKHRYEIWNNFLKESCL